MPTIIKKRPAVDAETVAAPNKKAVILDTKMLPIRALKPYYKNARIGDVGLIADSLLHNGQFRSIVVNIGTHTGRKNEILAGNHTYEAAKHLGWTSIRADIVDVSEGRARSIVLADNKSAEAGGYDPEKLLELIDLQQEDGLLDDAVFTAGEADALRKEAEKAIKDAEISLADLMTPDKPVTTEERKEQRDARLTEISERIKNPEFIEAQQAEEDEDDDEDFEMPSKDEARSLAELQTRLELKEVEEWYGNNLWQIPELLPDKILDHVDSNLRAWAGEESTPDDGKQQFLYNYSLGGLRGLPFDRAILSFFTHDSNFETWWETPAFNLAKAMQQGITKAVCMDNSFYYTTPRVTHLQGVYRSQWLGRFMQEAGLEVIPRVQFADKESLKFNMTGIPIGTPTLACSIQNFADANTKAERNDLAMKYLGLLQECIDKLKPSNQVIVYGGETLQKNLHILDTRGAELVPVLNYVAERREVAFGKKEGKTGLTAKERTEIRQRVVAESAPKPLAKKVIRKRVVTEA